MFSWFKFWKQPATEAECSEPQDDRRKVIEPHPSNVVGPFYVEKGCCTLCIAPFIDAPDMFKVNDAEDHCYVYHQPDTDEQVNRMIKAMDAAEFRCIRCRSDDPILLEKIRDAGEGEQCDVEL